ncbi:hypothetical protein CN947_23370 [Bacillus cereus]|nr:hypothetical protein CN947_23370 [Bacillus cereus]
MEIKVIHSVELPFIINLPNGVYKIKVNFRGSSYHLDLQISNTKYKVKTTYQGKDAYFEVEEYEIPTLDEDEKNNHREKLRTHIFWEVKKVFNVTTGYFIKCFNIGVFIIWSSLDKIFITILLDKLLFVDKISGKIIHSLRRD